MSDNVQLNKTSMQNYMFDYLEYVKLRQISLLGVAFMVFTNKGCWHCCIENDSVVDYPDTNNDTSCKNVCPFCINRCSNFILPVHKKGTIKMLADLFIADCIGEIIKRVLVGVLII